LINQATILNMKLLYSSFIYVCLFVCGLSSTASAEQASRSPWAYEYMTNPQKGNCIACHDLPGLSGLASNFGPNLKGVGAKWSRDDLVRWVSDARTIKPDTLMPPYGNHQGLVKVNPTRKVLTAEEIKHVVDLLQTWR
jgi:sulfur-oxidizing protein SoxX